MENKCLDINEEEFVENNTNYKPCMQCLDENDILRNMTYSIPPWMAVSESTKYVLILHSVLKSEKKVQFSL